MIGSMSGRANRVIGMGFSRYERTHVALRTCVLVSIGCAHLDFMERFDRSRAERFFK